MSLEAPEGIRFVMRSRIFTDAEAAALEAAGQSIRGDDPCAPVALGAGEHKA